MCYSHVGCCSHHCHCYHYHWWQSPWCSPAVTLSVAPIVAQPAPTKFELKVGTLEIKADQVNVENNKRLSKKKSHRW